MSVLPCSSFGVTENTPPEATLNLAYEIAYWRYGLDVAREWKKLLGLPVPSTWTTVAENLARPPQIDGLYAVYDGLNGSWWQDPALNRDPRSLIMMQGILPDTPAVDEEVARRTADKVWEVWTDVNIRGWGRPVLAINSARVGNPERAIYHLTAYDYWKFDDAGEFRLVAPGRHTRDAAPLSLEFHGVCCWRCFLRRYVALLTHLSSV